MSDRVWHECKGCGCKVENTGGHCAICHSVLLPMPPPLEGFHHCPRCGKHVANERRELLNIEQCATCTPQKPPPKGAWDYPEGFHERNEGVGGLIIID